MRIAACVLLMAGVVALSGADAGSARPPNILLVSLDTTRVDHLGLYGYARNTSPELDRLAADSVVYTRAYSVSSWTLPAHASLFTGKYPSSHGAILDPEGSIALANAIRGPEFLDKYRVNALASSQATLAGILRGAGYATGAVVGGPWMKRIFGLDHGFAHYDDNEISSVSGRLAKQVTDAALPWVEARRDEPFFLFLNYYDPHGPYSDPEGLATQFLPPEISVYPPPPKPDAVYREATYDGEIRYMDRHIGRLLARLRELDLYDDLWIIVTADHGELLGEHGSYGHGFTLYEEELRIPMIVKHPAGERPPGRDDRPVQLTDVLPWVLERLALPLPEPLRVNRKSGGLPSVYAEVYPIKKIGWRAWVRGDHKYLWNTRKREFLYDLAADPGESTNLAAGTPVRVRTMQSSLEAFRARLPAPPARGEERAVDAETQRALESLGYLE